MFGRVIRTDGDLRGEREREKKKSGEEGRRLNRDRRTREIHESLLTSAVRRVLPFFSAVITEKCGKGPVEEHRRFAEGRRACATGK